MDYISADEAALQWNVGLRQVQKLCSDGRIPGAKRVGKVWLLPSDAEKPSRKKGDDAEKQNAEPETANLVGLTQEMIDDFYMSKFVTVTSLCSELWRNDNCFVRYCALYFGTMASIKIGDVRAVKSTINYVNKTINTTQDEMIRICCVLIKDAVQVELNVLGDISEMMKSGDFTKLPRPLLSTAYCTHCKYLLIMENYPRLYGTARTVLNFLGERHMLSIYMNLFISATLFHLERNEAASNRVKKAMIMGKEKGFYVPILETMTYLHDRAGATCFDRRNDLT